MPRGPAVVVVVLAAAQAGPLAFGVAQRGFRGKAVVLDETLPSLPAERTAA